MGIFDYLFQSNSETSQPSQKALLWRTSIFHYFVPIGIRPETHSPGMFSWFPIFFPIKVGIAFKTP